MPVCFMELLYIVTDWPLGLTDNSVYWQYSSNNWNRNTHKNFKNNSQEITLHLYIQYFSLIALATVCLVQLSTDTGLEHSTSQICSHTQSTLCVSSAKSPALSAVHSPHSGISHKLTHHDMNVPHLTVRCPYLLLIHCLRPLLFQLGLDISFSYLPASLMSEATHVTTILGAVALCYNIFLYNMLY
jgi:hypothetical protein